MCDIFLTLCEGKMCNVEDVNVHKGSYENSTVHMSHNCSVKFEL